MCEHCGCRQVAPITELMEEHSALLDLSCDVHQALSQGSTRTAKAHLDLLIEYLDRHVEREESGVFRALRAAGEFVEEIDQLEAEHHDFAAQITNLDADAAEFHIRVTRLLDDLALHVEREDLGIFPVSVVTLGAQGWAIVDQAHTEAPSFLLDAARNSRGLKER